MVELEVKKETRGGTRQGSGAKPKYSEQTKTVAFRCPMSKANNRSISKLLVIMRNNIHLMDTFGLCFLTGMLLRNNILTEEKVKILRYFLRCNLPNDDMKYDTYYCWPKGEKNQELIG